MSLLTDFAADIATEFAGLDLTEEVIYKLATGGIVPTQAAILVIDGQSTEWAGGVSMAAEVQILKSAVSLPAPHDTIEQTDGTTWQVVQIGGEGGATWSLLCVRNQRPNR